MEKMKTLEDFGLKFDPDEDCFTCSEGACHNISTSLTDGKEYSVHISTNMDKSPVFITISENTTTFENEEVRFETEQEAISYLCANFDKFKCF